MTRPGGGLRGAAAVAIALICAGCTGSLLETGMPASTSYVLAPASAAPGAAVPTQADLSIGRPELAPGLDSERIAVLKGRQLDYYRTARWGGQAAEVVQTLLVDSFQDQRLFRSVTAEQSRVASEYVLDIAVRDFQAQYAGGEAAPSVRITLVARLIRVTDRQLVATLLAQAQTAAAENRMSAVVAAFEAAAHQVAIELAQKTAAAITGDERSTHSR